MNDYSGYGEVKLGDRVLPFKFGTNATALFCKAHNIDLFEIGSIMTGPLAILEYAYYAYVTAQRINRQTVDVTIDEFMNLVDDNKDAITLFDNLIMSSKILGFTIEELVKEGAALAKKNI